MKTELQQSASVSQVKVVTSTPVNWHVETPHTMTGSHVYFRSGIISKMVLDRDFVTTGH